MKINFPSESWKIALWAVLVQLAYFGLIFLSYVLFPQPENVGSQAVGGYLMMGVFLFSFLDLIPILSLSFKKTRKIGSVLAFLLSLYFIYVGLDNFTSGLMDLFKFLAGISMTLSGLLFLIAGFVGWKGK